MPLLLGLTFLQYPGRCLVDRLFFFDHGLQAPNFGWIGLTLQPGLEVFNVLITNKLCRTHLSTAMENCTIPCSRGSDVGRGVPQRIYS